MTDIKSFENLSSNKYSLDDVTSLVDKDTVSNIKTRIKRQNKKLVKLTERKDKIVQDFTRWDNLMDLYNSATSVGSYLHSLSSTSVRLISSELNKIDKEMIEDVNHAKQYPKNMGSYIVDLNKKCDRLQTLLVKVVDTNDKNIKILSETFDKFN